MRPSRLQRGRVLVPAMLAALALGLAGCGGEDVDEPLRGNEASVVEETPATPTPESPTPTPEPTADPNPLAGLRPCALLSAGEARALGLAEERAERVGAVRVCRWRYEGATLTDSYTVGVELFEQYGLKDLIAPEVRPVRKLGAHRAAEFVGLADGCGVAIATSPSSRVDATAVGGEHAGACRLAMQIARAVEPRLP